MSQFNLHHDDHGVLFQYVGPFDLAININLIEDGYTRMRRADSRFEIRVPWSQPIADLRYFLDARPMASLNIDVQIEDQNHAFRNCICDRLAIDYRGVATLSWVMRTRYSEMRIEERYWVEERWDDWMHILALAARQPRNVPQERVAEADDQINWMEEGF